jgi:Ras homolog gene family, member A
MCFSVDNPASAANVIEEWNPEVRHFCGRCPVILVACKIDLRADPAVIDELRAQKLTPVTTDEGKQIALQIKADAYMECSAKTREGVHDLFMRAARLSLEKRSTSHHRRRRPCRVL